MNPILTIAAKELTDGWRDRRAVASAALYSLMGPGVVGMVSFAIHDAGRVLIAMMSVFTLVAAFVGGVNVAMDAIAGERERRSLVPLLMHPVTRRDLVLGKWLAVSAFDSAGLALNLAGFALLFRRVPSPAFAFLLPPLCFLAAALEIWISTLCRGVKEAHTYLSMLVFLPMMAGMFMVFSPVAGQGWWKFVPVAGHQLLIEAGMRGAPSDWPAIAAIGLATAIAAAMAIIAAARRLEQDDVVYGG
ncbi:MAG TPA: ABC transporter permease subunit [Bryobacteraceae bacterium]|nr:ABC transporter permease subunit [Bryobacteraceae bacterium]